MARTLTYAGKNLTDFSVWWDNSRIFNKPPKLYQSFDIPNRNGTLLSSLNKFENIQIEYDCFIKDNFKDNYNDLIDFLTSFNTYQKLENSEEPETYRMGVFRAEVSTETGQFLKDGRFTLVFDCKPQNYYEAGDEPVQLALYDGQIQGENQWLGETFLVGDVRIIYSAPNKRYQLYGQITSASYSASSFIPIPSAGVWIINISVLGVETTANNRVYLSIDESEEMAVNPNNTLTYIYTATQETQLSFKIRSTGGESVTINQAIQAELFKTSTTPTVFNNLSLKPAKPLIMYNDVGHETTITVNTKYILKYTPLTWARDNNGVLYIDCEMMDCYLLKADGARVNYNPQVSITEFPTLGKGISTAYATYGTVRIIPRWWRL